MFKFGQRLRDLREAAKMKQDTLGQELDLDQPGISKLEKDKKPTRAQIYKLAEIFGCTPWSLVGGTAEASIIEDENVVGIANEGTLRWLAYFASGLTGLLDDQRALLQADADVARRICEEIRAYLYEPAQFTDPVRNQDLSPQKVYSIDHAQVSRSNFIILDGRYPSFGAGQELEIAAGAGIPVVLLHPNGAKVSRMVTGTFARLFWVQFGSHEELSQKLRATFSELVAELANLNRNERLYSSEEEPLGRRLRRVRDEAHLDVPTVSRLAGISPHALEQYEKGSGNPSIMVLQRLAGILRTSLSYLVSGVHTHPEQTDPVLRKSKDSLHAFAVRSNLTLQDVNTLWRTYDEEYRAQRRTVAEARAEPVPDREWAERHAQLKSGAKSGAAQTGMFGDV